MSAHSEEAMIGDNDLKTMVEEDAVSTSRVSSTSDIFARIVGNARTSLTLDRFENLFAGKIPHLKEVFEVFDSNGDGEVSEVEFTKVVEENPVLIEALWESLDTDEPQQNDDVVVVDVVEEDYNRDGDVPESYSDLIKKVALLETELKDARISEQMMRDSLQEMYDTHANDVTDLEGQLKEFEEQVQMLRQENQRLRDASATLDAQNEQLQTKPVKSSVEDHGSSSQSSPRSITADMDEMLRSIRFERDDLLNKVDELAEEISELKQDRDNDKRTFASQRRVSESSLNQMQDLNESLRLQISELEKLKQENAELKDILDEQSASIRQIAVAAERPTSSVGAPESDMQFAYDMLQVQLDDAKKALSAKSGDIEQEIQTATKEMKSKNAELNAVLAVANAKLKSHTKELAKMNSTNAGLNAQVLALGKALDKMKSYVDAKTTPKKTGIIGRFLGSRAQSMSSSTALSTTSALSSPRVGAAKQLSMATLPVDPLPNAPVEMSRMSPTGKQSLTSHKSVNGIVEPVSPEPPHGLRSL